jgi:hypothetical protein
VDNPKGYTQEELDKVAEVGKALPKAEQGDSGKETTGETLGAKNPEETPKKRATVEKGSADKGGPGGIMAGKARSSGAAVGVRVRGGESRTIKKKPVIKSNTKPLDKKGQEDLFESLGAVSPTSVEAPERKSSPQSGAPTSLSREQLSRGFVNIRKSVFQCVEKQTRRSGDDFAAGKVNITVTISNSGAVSGVNIGSGMGRSVFGMCMKSHKGRWRFPPFSGSPMMVKRAFVIQ